MSSTPSATGKQTVPLTPEPVRVVPEGSADTAGWTLSGPSPRSAVGESAALQWDDATLRDALQRIPAVDELAQPGAPDSAQARLFGAREAVRLGRLELIARIGSGGMGEVYAARDLELDRQVAVKIVRSDNDADRRDATVRIIREAQMMARVTHPNVVRVYDVGRIESRVYITMEYVQGATLREWLGRAPRSWRDILEFYIRAGRGLAAAHRTGLVHRDFKPSNVLVGDDDRVLVADFGLARTVGGEPETASNSGRSLASASPSLQPVTAHGTVLGTPGYMSPEQLRAAPVDARSDLFSFCAALYEALHGVRPFAGRTVDSLLANIDAGAITPPTTKVRIPARVAKAIARGLQVDRERRFATMDVLLAELERALRRPGRAIGASVVVAAGLVAGSALAGVGPFAAVDPCAAAGNELAATWNDARRDELRAGFAATGLDFAAAAAERVGAQLDAYVASWARARVDACEATVVRHEQSPQLFDLRMTCLERRRRAVHALVDMFAQADRTTVEQAVDSLATLPAIEPCGDPEWLVRSVQPPEAHDVAIAVARAREDIARGDALYATGHYREGLALANTTMSGLAAVDYEPVRGEALALRGRLLAKLGELDAGESTMLEAAELAEATRHDELAADVWLDLVRAANDRLDPSRSAAWIPRARASQRRIGDPATRRVRVLYEQAYLHYLERSYEASERVFRAALALHEGIAGDMRMRGRLVQGLAHTLEASGQHAAARAAYEQAIAATETAVGPDHPEFAAVLYNFSTLLLVLGELDEAGTRLAAALDIHTRAFGPIHHTIGRIHIALVELAMRRGAFAEAIAHARTATQIYRETLPDEHRARVDAEVALGTARFYGGELEAALDAFLAARELQRRVPKPDPISLAVTACDIAETQTALARHAEASASFAEVDRLLAQAPVRDRDLEARVLTGRANIALAEGDARRALPLLEAAVDLRKQLPDDPLALAELQEALIRARAG